VLHLLVCLFTLFLYTLCLYLFTINLPFLVNKKFHSIVSIATRCMRCVGRFEPKTPFEAAAAAALIVTLRTSVLFVLNIEYFAKHTLNKSLGLPL